MRQDRSGSARGTWRARNAFWLSKPLSRVVSACVLAGAIGAFSPVAAAGLAPEPVEMFAALGSADELARSGTNREDASSVNSVRVAGFGPPLVLLETDGPLAGAHLGAGADNKAMADRMLALAAFLGALCLMRLTAMRVR